MNTINIPGISPWILVLIVLWTIPWKGIALWKAARLSHKWWFVVMLVVNTVGILEIIYIFLIARKYNVETVDAGEKEPTPEPKPTIYVSQTKTTETKTTVTTPTVPEVETKNSTEKTESSLEK